MIGARKIADLTPDVSEDAGLEPVDSGKARAPDLLDFMDTAPQLRKVTPPLEKIECRSLLDLMEEGDSGRVAARQEAPRQLDLLVPEQMPGNDNAGRQRSLGSSFWGAVSTGLTRLFAWPWKRLLIACLIGLVFGTVVSAGWSFLFPQKVSSIDALIARELARGQTFGWLFSAMKTGGVLGAVIGFALVLIRRNRLMKSARGGPKNPRAGVRTSVYSPWTGEDR